MKNRFEIIEKMGQDVYFVVMEHGERPLRYDFLLFEIESKTKTVPYSQYCGRMRSTGCSEYDVDYIEPYCFKTREEAQEYINNRNRIDNNNQ